VNKSRPTYRELEKRLAAAEPIVEALKRQEVDAVVGEEKIAFLLLREVGEALQNSDTGFRAMFELPGIGMVLADTPALRFNKVNRKFCEIVGYSAEELLTKTYIGLTHPLDRRRDMKGLTQVLRGEADSWSIEKRCIRKDGSVIWMGVNGAALRNDAGRVVRIMAMVSDITTYKQAEQDKPMRLKKTVVKKAAAKKTAAKKARETVSKESSGKPRPKRR
jgi:PAS domain S-box-containing protein